MVQAGDAAGAGPEKRLATGHWPTGRKALLRGKACPVATAASGLERVGQSEVQNRVVSQSVSRLDDWDKNGLTSRHFAGDFIEG